MKNSITAKIVLLFGVVVIIVVAIISYLAADRVSDNIEIFFEREGRLAVSVVAKSYNMDADKRHEYLTALCEENHLSYAYIIEPISISVDGTDYIRYVELAHSSSIEESVIEDIVIGKSKAANLTQIEKDILCGKIEKAVVESRNQYGDENSYMEAIYDDAGKCIALAGIDISISLMEEKYADSFYSVVFFMLIITLFFMIIIFFILRHQIFRPVQNIKKNMEEFVAGDGLNLEEIPVKGKDEFSVIAQSFNNVKRDIKNYIDILDVMNAEKDQQQAEMDVAASIQLQMLPQENYVEKNVEIAAITMPAKTVGGDFYYYKNLSDGKWCVAIADVSGKGIWAALFMAKAITVLNESCKYHEVPGNILAVINNELAKNNEEMMFVTMFLAIYDEKNKTLTYSNAGHNLPYVIKDHDIEVLDEARGTALGFFEDEEYDNQTIKLSYGDVIYLFTDGVSEAVNDHDQFFGEERVEACLKAYKRGHETPKDLIQTIINRIEEFCNDRSQFDDITMIAASFSKKMYLELEPKLNELDKIKEIIIEKAYIQKDLQKQIFLAVEEIFVNIVSYSMENKVDQAGYIHFNMYLDGDSIIIEFRDNGKPYNPLEDVYQPENEDELLIGGYGKFIAFSIMDEQEYEYINNENVLVLKKNILSI